jgi:hypothetical protein
VELASLVNAYRVQNGLDTIPYSGHLFQVAHVHTRDLVWNTPDGGNCNLHSWSSSTAGFDVDWDPVCYTSDHAYASLMWSKPEEVSAGAFPYNGYENAAMGTNMEPEDYLNLWQNSSGHNDVILNNSIWQNYTWQSLGVSIYGDHAVLWFSAQADSKPLQQCE